MMEGLSIRLKLTLWYTGVLACVLLFFAAVVYVSRREQLMRRIDAGLREELSHVAGEIKRATEQERMLYWLNRRFSDHTGFHFQVIDENGMLLFGNARRGEEQLSMVTSQPMGKEVFLISRERARPGNNQHKQRIVMRKVRGPEGTLIVRIAQSLASYHREMRALAWILAFTAPATLMVAMGGGYLLSARALAPVKNMTQAANTITAQHLDRRLEISNPRDELGRLAVTLNGMIERLENSFHEIRRFTADASHELRTPISVIRSEAEVALSQPENMNAPRKLLSNILEECQWLTHITDQLLVLSREDAGVTSPCLARVNLTGLVTGVAETMRPLAESRGQHLHVEANGEAAIMGDPTRLRQVFYNVLDNAFKYTPEAGTISVSVGVDSETVSARITDTGIGITAEHLPRVFDRFYRVDKARSRSERSSGLGLSIVEAIVSAHHATVELNSQQGTGTVCTIAFRRC